MTSPRLWPRSLQGQLLLAVALALLLAQGIGAALVWREQAGRREAALVHTAAFRIFSSERGARLKVAGHERHLPEILAASRRLRIEQADRSPLREDEQRIEEAEEELASILRDQGLAISEVVVIHRPIGTDPALGRHLAHRMRMFGQPAPQDGMVFVAGVQRAEDGKWLVVRVPAQRNEGRLFASLIGQTLFIYALLVGAIALILRRMTRPLSALTGRMEHFAGTRDATGQIEPQGPDDVRRLIVAHNGLEARISALLDEKDVMLGAIGHDLKTPLAALRVRIESVENEAERSRMAATIEDIARSLDDILSLARVGRPSDPKEPIQLGALLAQVAEEFEDMGEPVTCDPGERLVVSARATWLRRALRNLVSNALRYGGTARIGLRRDGGFAVITVDDDGPGIPEADIARMLEPFARGDPSRNSETGGAGLGLTLARAIAEQHGGTLSLVNRRDAAGQVTGLSAALRLPL